MIRTRIEPTVNAQLLKEQVNFHSGRSTVDKVTLLLPQDIKDSFQANEKAGVVLMDLTAAYGIVWHSVAQRITPKAPAVVPR